MSEINTKLCPYCSEEILATAIKCKHCGSMLADDPYLIASEKLETYIKVALSKKFELIREIGRGGMAIVYKARQKNLDRIVALKILPQQFTYDKEFLEYFHREARAAANLNHPNIVTIFDEGCENGIHFIAMEYLSGIDLYSFIKREGQLSLALTVNLISQVAQALDYAHKKGIIHRDVKSSNIIYTDSGRAVLTDFGLARALVGTKSAMSGSIMGTPEYMSPEQAEGRFLDGRSDLFSLGIVLYECLTGKLPFKGDNPLGVIYNMINSRPYPIEELRKDLPQWMISIVYKALNKSPDMRFQSGEEFCQALLNKGFFEDKKTIKVRKSKDLLLIQKEKQTIKINKPNFKLKKINSEAYTFIIGLMVSLISILLITILTSKNSYVNDQIMINKENSDLQEIIRESFDEQSERNEKSSKQINSRNNRSNEILIHNNEKLNIYENQQIQINDEKQRQIDALLQEGDNYIRNYKLDEALSSFNKVLQLDPENERAIEGMNQVFNNLIQIGEQKENEGNYFEAFNYYDRASRLKPDNIKIRIKKTQLQRKINQ